MTSPIPGLSQFNLFLILLIDIAPKIPFIQNKKRKTEEQLRCERSSARADPNRISGLSFYPTSSNPSQPPSQPQGQDNPGGSSSHAIIRSIAAPPLGPPVTFDLKFNGQRFWNHHAGRMVLSSTG
jgi:hypothetical protein